MTTELPAPMSVLHLVKYGCQTKRPTDRCSCRTAGHNCTDICRWSDDVESCIKVEQIARECDENVAEDNEEGDEDEV